MATTSKKSVSKKAPAKRRASTKKGTARKTRAHMVEVTQLPPAKAKGVKTTADIRNPRKSKKAAAKKATAKKSTARRDSAKKTSRKSSSKVLWRLSDFSNEDKITVTTKKNPYRDGTKMAKKFVFFKTGFTVGQTLDVMKKSKCRDRSAIRRAINDGHIKVGKVGKAAKKAA